MSIRLGNNIIAGSYAVVQNAVYTKDETNNLLDNKADKEDLSIVATTGKYNDLLDKPFIPTDTSDLTNNAGYITNSNLTSYAKTNDVNNKLLLKQDVLTVGEGISIQGNTISNTYVSGEWGNISGDINTQEDLKSLLDNKLNKDLSNSDKPYITDIYNNGVSKYCIWSDGRKEQWGRATSKNITFYAPYTDDSYIFTVSIELGTGTISNISDLCYSNKNNLGVIWSTDLGDGIKSIDWYACGY